MRLGIDFGTTRTVVAAVDRGNYPIVNFVADDGEVMEWYPSVIAATPKKWLFGCDALQQIRNQTTPLIRSIKTILSEIHPFEPVNLDALTTPALELLTLFLKQLKQDIYNRSNLEINKKEPLEAYVAVPANANNHQRFLTLEAFQNAGFRILGMVDEPSAAAVEYAHRYTKMGNKGEKFLTVYDLGGGTFDVSVIKIGKQLNDVICTEGISKLGGDNFDQILYELVLEQAKIASPLHKIQRFQLLEECREKKEGLHPNTRKVVVELSKVLENQADVTIPVNSLYQRCTPLIEQTIDVIENAVAKAADISNHSINIMNNFYIVGGGSELPIVARLLRDKFGRKVRRSACAHGATAIGLAIISNHEANSKILGQFTRHFGVWREQNAGKTVCFDSIFDKGTKLPTPGSSPIIRTHRYKPIHNIGHFRYLECSHFDANNQPTGEFTPWNDICFPYDPTLYKQTKLDKVPISKLDSALETGIEERYQCDSNGIIQVTIDNIVTGYQRSYLLRDTK